MLVRSFFVLLCLLNATLSAFTIEEFYRGPPLLSGTQIRQIRETGSLDMSWYFDSNIFRLRADRVSTSVEIIIYDENASLLRDEKTSPHFTQGRDSEGRFYRYYTYTHQIDGTEHFRLAPQKSDPSAADEEAYLVHNRKDPRGNPQRISIEDLKPFLEENSIVFYTGPALSQPAGVPSRTEFEATLGLEKGAGFAESLRAFIFQPREQIYPIRRFYRSCFGGEPTASHQILTDFALRYGTRILTENPDCLHEAAGILPYRIETERVRNEFPPKLLQSIDYVICVGLDRDDRGFLGWFKHNHPEGRVIALSEGVPEYLGDEDFLVAGPPHRSLRILKTFF